MADDDEWKKLPTDQKVAHKSWKARAEGYKECIKNFQIYDEKSADFNKYLGLIKKFVTDTNELNRIQGVKAANIYVQNAHVAGKTVCEVVSGVVLKCFNTKPALKEAAVELCLNYIEIDKQEAVIEELVKGFDNKQPKVVNSCVETLTRALSEFGPKIIAVGVLMKQSKKLVDHRDKNVRESTKQMLIEIYRWIKDGIRMPLQSINPVVLKELEGEWDKISGESTKQQTRFMRSQSALKDKYEAKQQKQAESSAAGDTGNADGDDGEEEETIDPYTLIDPVEILSQLPKDFYDKIEAKKWQERKEVLEIVEKLSQNPKLVAGDYADLLKALKKVIAKDTNILLVTIAIKCVGGIATGLRKKFQPYAILCLESMFERFKEKKATVLQALKDATDAVADTIPLTNIQESLVEYLAHKNPSVRAQIGYFMGRVLIKMKSVQITKALLKAFIKPLLTNLDHGTPDVREGAYTAIGTCMLKIGEAKIMPFIADVDKIKLDKIKDTSQKLTPQSTTNNSTAGGDTTSNKPAATTSSNVEKKPPASAVTKKPTLGGGKDKKKIVRPGTSAGSGKSSSKTNQSANAAAKKEATFDEVELSEDDVEIKIDDVFNADIKSQITNSNWKERFAGLQEAHNKLKILNSEQIPAQAIVKYLAMKKPGLKDSNFNCLNEKFAIIKYTAENSYFSMKSIEACMTSLVDKIGDIKCGNAAREALTSMCEATSFPMLSKQIMEYAMSKTNPKLQSETLKWFSIGLIEFGVDGVDIKLCIKYTKTTLSATNMAVRKNALLIVRSLAIFLGEMIMTFYDDEKPAMKQQIQQEFDQVKNEPKPKPIRGKKSKGGTSGSGNNDNGDSNDEGSDNDAADVKLDDLVTRVDISSKITDDLLKKLSDPKWKERKEALESIQEILKEAKFVEPNLADLPVELKKRFKDSNKLLLITTLKILSQLAECLGKHCQTHLPTFIEGIIMSLSDSKPTVRQAAIQCMDCWYEKTKLSNWFQNDEIATCLSNPKHTYLRIELLKWLLDKLMAPTSVKQLKQHHENLELCVKHIYQCCEDRNSDIRSRSNDILPAFILHLSYKKMLQVASKLSASSKTTVTGLLETAQQNVPTLPTNPSKKKKPASATTSEQPAAGSGKSIRGGGMGDAVPPKKSSAAPSSTTTTTSKDDTNKDVSNAPTGKTKDDTKKKGTATSSSKSSSNKSAEQDATGGGAVVFIPQKNGKEIRHKDERNLKVLKWVFPAPRDEIIQQLRQQMTLCINSTVLTDMFHTDPKKHSEVIEKLLTKALSNEWQDIVGNLDVILRWFTLRFYDKNTTINLQSFKYLISVFDKLRSDGYKLNDYEANAFIPHLIIKIGDPKEPIRKNVHQVMELLMDTYDEKKIYQQAMAGTKSKNAKQRLGCLEVVKKLIDRYQTHVCDPTVPKACKDIAAFISDRDKTVRDGALDAIVSVFHDIGEITYKYVGKLSDKDMGMLEERIKRAPKPQPQHNKSIAPSSGSSIGGGRKLPMKESTTANNNSMMTTSSNDKTRDGKDKKSTTIDNKSSTTTKPSVPELPHEIQVLIDQIKELDDRYDNVPLPPCPIYQTPEWLQEEDISPNAKETLDLVISRLVDNDSDVCLKSIHEINEIVEKSKRDRGKFVLLEERINQLIGSITMKFKYLKERSLPDVVSQRSTSQLKSEFVKISQSYFSVVHTLFDTKTLLEKLTIYSVFDFLKASIQFMVDERLLLIDESNNFILSINSSLLEICNNCNPVLMSSATTKLVKDAVSNAPYLKNAIEKGDDYTRNSNLEYYRVAVRSHIKAVKRLMAKATEIDTRLLPDLMVEIDEYWQQYPPKNTQTKVFSDELKRKCETIMKNDHNSAGVDISDQNFMLKTLKTLILTLCDKRKQELAKYLHMVYENKSSPVMSCICKKLQISPSDLKNQVEYHKQQKQINDSKNSTTTSTHSKSMTMEARLADIFKRLSKTDTLEEAIEELYEFQQQFPNYDFESQYDEYIEFNFMKNFIKSYLKELAIKKNENLDADTKRSMLCDAYIEKASYPNFINDINEMRVKCGLEPDTTSMLPTSTTNNHTDDVDENFIDNNQITSSTASSLRHSSSKLKMMKSSSNRSVAGGGESTTNRTSASASASNLSDLKARFLRLQKSTKQNK